MKRLLEFEDEYDFSLLGISCHAKDYRLCWEMNNALSMDLEKGEPIIGKGKDDEENHFSTSEYFDEDNHLQYTLISNKFNGKLLIPEHPQLDYFLKLNGPQHDYELEDIKQRVQNIDLVLAALEVNPKNLKSKLNLVF